MKYDYYNKIEIAPDFETYDFVSEGAKGIIHKRIFFELIQDPAIYNLAFGDLTDNGEIDDYSISDNKDMTKILATIAAAIGLFLKNILKEKSFLEATLPKEHACIGWPLA